MEFLLKHLIDFFTQPDPYSGQVSLSFLGALLGAGTSILGGILNKKSKNKQLAAQNQAAQQQFDMSEDARLAQRAFINAALGGRGISEILSPELQKRLQTRQSYVPQTSGESFLGSLLSEVGPHLPGGALDQAFGGGTGRLKMPTTPGGDIAAIDPRRVFAPTSKLGLDTDLFGGGNG